LDLLYRIKRETEEKKYKVDTYYFLLNMTIFFLFGLLLTIFAINRHGGFDTSW
jgi:hypothetical protein